MSFFVALVRKAEPMRLLLLDCHWSLLMLFSRSCTTVGGATALVVPLRCSDLAAPK